MANVSNYCFVPFLKSFHILLKNCFKISFCFYFWLCCCAQAFSSCCEKGYFFLAVHGLLIGMASLIAEHRQQAHGLQQLQLTGSRAWAQQLWGMGLAAPQHVGSSRTRDQTYVHCVGRWIPNPQTTREVPYSFL